jgi:hypothetical protein
MSWHVAGHDEMALPPHEQTELSGRLGALVESVGQSPGEPQHWLKSWLYVSVQPALLESASTHTPSESADAQTTSPTVGPVQLDVVQS